MGKKDVSKIMLAKKIGALYKNERAFLSKLTPDIVMDIQRAVSKGYSSLSPLKSELIERSYASYL